MKVLICGVSGLVGRDLAVCLSNEQIPWIGTHFSRPCPNSKQVNFLNYSELQKFFEIEKPSHCVNCIAERSVEKCEQQWESTKKINIDIPSNLSKLCNEYQIPFYHISTDYVFDGAKPPYTPESLPNPLQSYGISKLIAELRVKLNHPKACILRVPVLYTNNYKNLEETAVTLIGKKVLDRTTVHKEDNYCIRRPVFIPDLCKYILQCIQTDTQGIIHYYNSFDKETKYSIASLIGKYLNKSIHDIHPVNEAPSSQAGRPYDTQLFVKADTKEYFTPLPLGIQHCFEKLYHPAVYLQRNPSEDCFWMIDLDGTLIDTEQLHLNAYNHILQLRKKDLRLDSVEAIESTIIHEYGLSEYREIRNEKNHIFQQNIKTVDFLPGAEELLNYFLRFNINFVIVTNTSQINKEFFQSKLPLLEKCTQWVTRDDVTNGKPHSESYELAKSKYYKNEKYIVGIENTINGYKSLKNVTKCIYMVCKYKSHVYNSLLHEDIYFIKDVSDIYTSVPI